MSTTKPYVDLVDLLCEKMASLPYPEIQELLTDLRTSPVAVQKALRKLLSILPEAVERLRSEAANYDEKQLAEIDRVDDALAELRGRRDQMEMVYLRFEELFQDTIELLQNHLQTAALSTKALHFAQTVSVDSYKMAEAQRASAEGQEQLWEYCNELASDVVREYSESSLALLKYAEEASGMNPSWPRPLVFRPEEFSPVRYFATIDIYEQVRVLVQGENLPNGMKPVKKPLFSLARITGIPVSLMTAGIGLQSLVHARRGQMRRELVGAGAEQMRRVLSTAMNQLRAHHFGIERQLRQATIERYTGESGRLSSQLAELARSRRRAHSYAARAERLLSSVERLAHEILGRVEEFEYSRSLQ